MGVPGSNPGGPIIFGRKIEGAILILPEAKEHWARGGCSGANIPAASGSQKSNKISESICLSS